MAFVYKECRKCRAFRKISLFILFGAFFSLLGTTFCYGESAPIFYTVRIRAIRDDVALHVREGDTVTDPVGKYNIGTVGRVELRSAMTENYSSEKNEMVLSELEGYSDVYITVSASGERDGALAYIGSYRIYVGKTVPLRLPDFCGVGVCVGIGEKNGRT